MNSFEQSDFWTRLRAKAAVFAAFSAVLLCALRHHVHIVAADPGTYASPFHHKCGLLMMGCVAWAMAELGLGQRIAQRLLPRAPLHAGAERDA